MRKLQQAFIIMTAVLSISSAAAVTGYANPYLEEDFVPAVEAAAVVNDESDVSLEAPEASSEIIASGLGDRRKDIVNFALSFVGGRYVYGGTSPSTGFDCSGFVRYIMQNAAGISMQRSSASQASQGIAVDASRMQAGDLIFYGGGGGINHVAIYAGDGMVVHASSSTTGVIVTPWNYRAPVRIMNVLGQ